MVVIAVGEVVGARINRAAIDSGYHVFVEEETKRSCVALSTRLRAGRFPCRPRKGAF